MSGDPFPALGNVLRDYLAKVLGGAAAAGQASGSSGMKVLLVDEDTIQTISTVLSQTEILQKDVFLVERLAAVQASANANDSESLAHMRAICVVRPTETNVRLLKKFYLARPQKYRSYSLVFSNAVRDAQLQDLADADQYSQVDLVLEAFMDYVAVDRDHFRVALAQDQAASLTNPLADVTLVTHAVDRCVEGVASLMLSLKKRPVIRYTRTSATASKVANGLHTLMYDEERQLFDFPSSRSATTSPLLLVLDRRDDPITPLLVQWTYQAMVHELIGMENNRVTIGKTTKESAGEVVMNAEQDDFFQGHRFTNYGDLAEAVQRLLREYQQTHNLLSTKGTDSAEVSIEDMQRFVEKYPEFKARQGNVTKHLGVLDKVNAIVQSRDLFTLSTLQQEMCAQQIGAADAFAEVSKHVVSNDAFTFLDKVKLCVCFALCFEKEWASKYKAQLMRDLEIVASDDALARARGKLSAGGSRVGGSGRARAYVELLSSVVEHVGSSKRTGDLFRNKSMAARARKAYTGLKGVENILTSHTPLLVDTVKDTLKGKLDVGQYPFAMGRNGWTPADFDACAKGSPSGVIVYLVGGATFEEAMHITRLNEAAGEVKILLGGSGGVVNSNAFLDALVETSEAAMRHR